MSPTENSDLTCLTGYDLERVSDLNRQDGETINLDYQDLYDLASLEKCREEAWRSLEVFGGSSGSPRLALRGLTSTPSCDYFAIYVIRGNPSRKYELKRFGLILD